MHLKFKMENTKCISNRKWNMQSANPKWNESKLLFRSHSRERRRQQEDERYERAKRAKEKLERSRLNKEKLLEIAKKNAAKILKSGGDYLGMDTVGMLLPYLGHLTSPSHFTELGNFLRNG